MLFKVKSTSDSETESEEGNKRHEHQLNQQETKNRKLFVYMLRSILDVVPELATARSHDDVKKLVGMPSSSYFKIVANRFCETILGSRKTKRDNVVLYNIKYFHPTRKST
jgi:hypothetical protein